MDKNTLSNYGWIVIAVLVLSVMIALATPFGSYIEQGVRSTTAGLFDTSEKALNVVGMSAVNGNSNSNDGSATKPSVNNLYSINQVIDGYYIHTGGVGKIFEDANCSYASVPVESGKDIYLSSAILNLTVPQGIIRFTDGEKQISYIREELTGFVIDGEYERSPVVKLTVPDGATRIEFNIRIGYDARETMVVSYDDLTKCWTPEKWYGKKWVVVGDSLSDPTTQYTTKQYYDYISEDTDIETFNMATRGTGYAKPSTSGGTNAFYNRVANTPTDADVITIFGSFNDFASEMQYGEISDTEPTTIAGCINTTLDTLYSVSPNAKIGVILPTPWASYNDVQPSSESTLYHATTYINLLIDICEKRNIPYLDLYHNSGLKPWDADFRSEYYSKDATPDNGVHPNEAGHQLIAPKIEDFIESLLK